MEIREDFLKEVASELGLDSLHKWAGLGWASDEQKAVSTQACKEAPVCVRWMDGDAGEAAVTEPGLDCLAKGGGLRLGGHEEPLEVLSRGTTSSTSSSGSNTGKA